MKPSTICQIASVPSFTATYWLWPSRWALVFAALFGAATAFWIASDLFMGWLRRGDLEIRRGDWDIRR